MGAPSIFLLFWRAARVGASFHLSAFQIGCRAPIVADASCGFSGEKDNEKGDGGSSSPSSSSPSSLLSVCLSVSLSLSVSVSLSLSLPLLLLLFVVFVVIAVVVVLLLLVVVVLLLPMIIVTTMVRAMTNMTMMVMHVLFSFLALVCLLLHFRLPLPPVAGGRWHSSAVCHSKPTMHQTTSYQLHSRGYNILASAVMLIIHRGSPRCSFPSGCLPKTETLFCCCCC